jgi:glucose/arabinose dehydrogenase
MKRALLSFGLSAVSVSVLVAVAAHGCSGDEANSTGSSTSSTGKGSGPTSGPGSGPGTGGGAQGGGGGATGSGGATGGAGQGGAGGTGGGATGSGGGSSGMLPPNKENCSPPQGTPGKLKLTSVVQGLSSPVLFKQAWGDDQRFYIVEQAGRIKLLKGGMVTTFLDITGVVACCGERGLLGLAFHPDYVQNGRFFVHYSDNNGDTALAEYKRSNNPDLADPTPVGLLFFADQPDSNHNGGSLEFSPLDKYLYLALGDGGGGGDQYGKGQNLSSLLAKILRFDIDKKDPGKAYAIPPGNMPKPPEAWDWGLRNPWRVSFDVCTGDLYIGDVGQNAWEEIDVEKAGDGNRNYGWPIREGNHDYNGGSTAGLTPATVEYANIGGGSVTGGYVYRGSAIGWLRGAYLYGDYVTTKLAMFRWNNGTVSDQKDLTQDLQEGLPSNVKPSSFGQDNAGEVYVVHHGGRIYRIDAE